MKSFWRRARGVGALYGLLSVLFCLPLFRRPLGLGIADWDRHLFYYAEVLKNVVEYGQLPFWSPWYCSGNVMWQNPQVALLSPVYPLTVIMPLALAMKVNIVLHYWIGFLGMHRLLTRIVKLSFVPLVVYAASIFTLAGSLVLHLAVGHSTFLTAFYLPWLLYFLCDSFQTGRVRSALGAAAVLAVTVVNGGMSIVPIALLAVMGLAIGTALAARDWRPIALALVVGLGGAAYAAPKLLPVMEFVTSDRFFDAGSPVEHPDRMTGGMIWRAYAEPSLAPDARVSNVQQHPWSEYGNYIGSLGAIAIGLGLLWPIVGASRPRRPFAIVVAVIALGFLLLSAGEFHVLAPANVLTRLPFPAFQVPSRYTIGFVLFGALAIGLAGRDAVARWMTNPTRRYGLTAVCAVGIVSLIFVNGRQFTRTFSEPPLDAGFRFFNGANGIEHDAAVKGHNPNAPMLRGLMQNRDVHYCYEPLQLVRGADVSRPLVWSEDGATISDVIFTPNRVRFAVVGGFAPSKVYLNQNYAPGWRSTAGPVLLDPSAGGKMYIQLASGQTGTFSFSFAPPGLWTGILLLVAAAVASVLVWDSRFAPAAASLPADAAIAVARTATFAVRAEHATRIVVLTSLVAALSIRCFVAAGHEAGFALIAAASFASAWAVSTRSEYAAGVVLAAMFVAPAVFANVGVHDANAAPLFLISGLLGAMWRQSTWRTWSLPAAWRVPLVGWALAAAVGWPLLVMREVDFHPEFDGMLGLPASAIGLSARSSIAIVADSAALLIISILWLDWLFQQQRNDRQRFRRVLVMPLLVGGTVAAAVAAYQLWGDITFLNAGWANFRRAGATMMDANGFGMAAVLCGCGFLACLDRARDRRWNGLMSGGFALSLVGTWASGSKTALFAELVALMFAAVHLARPALSSSRASGERRGRLLIVALAGIGAAALLFALRNTGPALRIGWILPGPSFDSFAAFTRLLWDRGGYGRAAVEMFQSHPWVGVGVGSFPFIAGDYPFSHMGGPLAPDNAQNWIRHNLAELGIVGSIGWIAWASIVIIGIVRRPHRLRDGTTTIIAGALAGTVLVSQVGMPTQNAVVAIVFWTFLFWYFQDQWAAPQSSDRSVGSWQWVLLTAAMVLFAMGTLETSLTTLRVPMRARQGGWNYVYGFHEEEQTASGEPFRRTDQEAVAVVRAPGRSVKLAVWVTRPDVASHPVLARVWHEQRLVIDTVLRDNHPVTTDLVLDRDPRMLMIRTYLNRTLPPAPTDQSLAVRWTFSDAAYVH